MPSVALLAAIGAQTLAELGAVPEGRGAGFSLGREPALARADLAPTSLAGLRVAKPTLDVPLSHNVPTSSARPARSGYPPATR